MAETRKYDPAAGNAIAQALRAAMGESVRPTEPGRGAPPSTTPEPQAPAATSWISLSVQRPAAPSPDERED